MTDKSKQLNMSASLVLEPLFQVSFEGVESGTVLDRKGQVIPKFTTYY